MASYTDGTGEYDFLAAEDVPEEPDGDLLSNSLLG